MSDTTSTNPPKRVFIVPYRDRIQQKFFFCKQMEFILEGQDDYEILFVHQCDARNFNRGAMKNIGFLAIKEKYPDSYKDISFIFNDVDTLPFHKLFDYETTEGVVKHYYGFETALGGIVVIKGSDFELINGYPNYWGWGMEDACLQKRCFAYGIQIDRSNFYNIGSPEILQLFDGVSRLVSRKDPQRMKTDNGQDGLRTIHKLLFTTDRESLNPDDNKYTVESERTFVVNVTSFMTMVRFEADSYHEYDLREPVSKVVFPDRESTTKTHIGPEEWRNIPYNPVADERVLMIQQQRAMAQRPQAQMLAQRMMPPQSPTTIFSPQYARMIGARPRATGSANIGLGGVRR
jgi:N-terminal region of glycosyl transferase group 7/N-terminal domain of galactosyltransferase